MSKTLIGCGLAVLGLVVLVALMVSGVYNNLVGLEEGVDAAWGQVENVYQRRADLIPNLVATVKGAADFEQETLQNVIEARAKVGQMNIEGAPTACPDAVLSGESGCAVVSPLEIAGGGGEIS